MDKRIQSFFMITAVTLLSFSDTLPISFSAFKRAAMACIQTRWSMQIKQNITSPLHKIITNPEYSSRDKIDVLQALLNAGVKINQYDYDGYSPLLLAVYWHDKEIVQFLLEQGASTKLQIPSETNKYSVQPLIAAIKEKQYEIVELLINAGADLNVVDHKGRTPLYLAIKNGKKKIAELLITQGADVNLATKKKNAPLYKAVKKGSLEFVEMLVFAGACFTNEHLHVAIKKKHNALIHCLISPYSGAVVRTLINKSNSDLINGKNSDGNTPVHTAVLTNNLDALLMLIEAGARLTNKNVKLAQELGHLMAAKFMQDNNNEQIQ